MSDNTNSLKAALKRRGLSQHEFARALGKKDSEISRWINGKIGISESNMARIKSVLGDYEITNEDQAIRIGVVGTGSIASRFVEELTYIDGITISSAYNPDFHEAEEFCRRYGISTVSNSIEELLSYVDAVYVASPCMSHYEYAKSALLSGRHVLCETPFTSSYKEAQELFKLAEQKGLILMLAIKTAYCPSFGKIIEDTHSGKIGQVVGVNVSTTTLLDDKVSLTYNNERLCENAIYGMLAVFKVLGMKIRDVCSFHRKCDGRLLYFNTTISFGDTIACINAGTGVKSESSLVISGTKGYIYVPSPWWKPDYYEIRYEDQNNNKKQYFPYESSGLRYEIKTFLDMILMRTTQMFITKEEALKLSSMSERLIINYLNK